MTYRKNLYIMICAFGISIFAVGCQSPDSGARAGGTGSGTDSGTDSAGGSATDSAPARPLLVEPEVVRGELSGGGAELEAGYRTGDGGGDPRGYAYNGQVPGPTIRARVGEVLAVGLQNGLDDPTTLHWHGVEAPEAMDGVIWLREPVAAGGRFAYEVPLNRAGTFWYHPHVDVLGQVDRGLYGALIVEAGPEAPETGAVDREVVLIADIAGEEAVAEAHGLPEPEAQRWTVNGQEEPVLEAAAGDRLRLRVLNAAVSGYLRLERADGGPLQQVGGGQGLRAAQEVTGVLLAPGERAELEWAVGAGEVDLVAAPWVAAGGAARGEPERLLTVRGIGTDTGATEVTESGSRLGQAPEAVSADPGWTDLVYVFSGSGQDWRINGEVYPDVTVARVPLGAPQIIEIRNLSSSAHPFHLHGNAFEVLSVDGVAPPGRRVEDTVDLPIRSVARLLLTPGNPGDWMLHCHLLDHENDGMMTVLGVGE